jgi:hypothetical protein
LCLPICSCYHFWPLVLPGVEVLPACLAIVAGLACINGLCQAFVATPGEMTTLRRWHSVTSCLIKKFKIWNLSNVTCHVKWLT